jgi:uncharacterized Zn finger protein (UPF0148 family)
MRFLARCPWCGRGGGLDALCEACGSPLSQQAEYGVSINAICAHGPLYHHVPREPSIAHLPQEERWRRERERAELRARADAAEDAAEAEHARAALEHARVLHERYRAEREAAAAEAAFARVAVEPMDWEARRKELRDAMVERLRKNPI